MIAGIDLGGTQVRLVIAHEDGRIVAAARTRTATVGGAAGMVDWTCVQADRLRVGHALRSVGIGAPGPIDAKRGILLNPPNLVGWRNVPLSEMVEDVLGCPVYLENDANVAALAEFHRGAGRAARNLVFITWSTGVGGGVILDGKLYSGSHGTAGEFGHMVLDPDGPLDSCGQRGCVEAFCGGRAVAAQTGESLLVIFDAAARGDREAAMIVRRLATYMGLLLINLTNGFDPDVIVIGGGVTRSWAQVEPVLKEVLHGSPFIRPARRPKIRRAQLGQRAGEVGAVEWARANLPTVAGLRGA